VTIAKKAFLLLILLAFPCSSSIANPCAGKGTAIFFINGLFNNKITAKGNLRALEKATKRELSEIKNLRYDLAWVEGDEGITRPIQLAMAAHQRGLDDFQRYWLWISGLEKPPSWFDEMIQTATFNPDVLNSTVLPRFKKHLELYSDAIIKGYQIILVSHSVGSFYANSSLRLLPDYISYALQSSIVDRRKENPFYPKSEEMIANVKIASTVKQTVQQSPWVSFKDDQVLNWIRKVVDVLPGNISASGVSSADLRAHSLIPSYLRVDESRNQIIQQIKAAYQKLRYPIPLFKSAATIQYKSVAGGKSTPHMASRFRFEKQDVTEVEEVRDENRDLFSQFSVRCYDLRPGTVDIRMTTIYDDKHHKDFQFSEFIGNATGDPVQTLTVTNPTDSSDWRLGSIQVSPGKEKDPIITEIKFLDRPANLP